MKSHFIALALALTLFQVHQVSAQADLAGLLQAVQEEGNGIGYNGTNIQWWTNNSSVSTLSDSVAWDHIQEMSSSSYGNLGIAVNLDEEGQNPPPSTSSGYDGIAGLEATWSDTVTISNATLNGTWGYLRPAILYSGTMSASCDSDSDSAFSQISFSVTGYSDFYTSPDQNNQGLGFNTPGQNVVAYATNSPQSVNINLDTAGLAAFVGVSNLDIPFIYGLPFDFLFSLELGSFGGGGSDETYDVLNHHGCLNLVWQGAQVLDANTNPVSDFTLTSDSGSNWAISQAGAPLQISGFNLMSGTNIVITSTNGTPFNQAYLLGSTNLSRAMTNWAYLATNTFDVFGHASFTNATALGRQYYFRLMSN
jgi:hypothetical protein